MYVNMGLNKMKKFRIETFKKGKKKVILVTADKVFVTDNLISFVKFYQYTGEENTTSEIIYSIKASLVDELLDLHEEDCVEVVKEE